MTTNEYQRLALRTEADQEKIRQRIYEAGPQATRLDNAARGLANDAGELSKAVGRWLEYGQPLDRANVVEEIGDCLWRLAQAAEAIGGTLEEAMRANIAKLRKRYPERYSDELAANRNHAEERKALDAATSN